MELCYGQICLRTECKIHLPIFSISFLSRDVHLGIIGLFRLYLALPIICRKFGNTKKMDPKKSQKYSVLTQNFSWCLQAPRTVFLPPTLPIPPHPCFWVLWGLALICQAALDRILSLSRFFCCCLKSFYKFVLQ